MQITSSQKRRIAVFFILGVVIFVGLILVVAGNRILKREDCYHTRFENVSVAGLSDGSGVKFQGMNIGTVSGISIDPQNTAVVQVNYCLKPGTPVKQGTLAQLGNIGITGLKFIELKGGGTGEDIPINGEIPSEMSSWDYLSGQTTIIAAKLESILNHVNLVVEDFDADSVGRVITNVEGITASLNTLLEENHESIHSILSRADLMLSNTNEFMASSTKISRNLVKLTDARGPVNQTFQLLNEGIVALTEDYKQAEVTQGIKEVFELVMSMQKTMDTINLTLMRSQENITASFDELHEGMMNFNEFTRIIMENPSAILQGRGPEELR